MKAAASGAAGTISTPTLMKVTFGFPLGAYSAAAD
jgi:hypothetical protein